MMIISTVFWVIIGLGIALPLTGILLFNLWLSITQGENYTLSMRRIGIMYGLALIGWAIFMGVK